MMSYAISWVIIRMSEESLLSRHWLRHTASVPRGFLRFYALEHLREKNMSGSEIIEEIQRETDGQWKPSPGSIYPILSWLKDNNYSIEVPTKESGLKRYTLTEKGKEFLEKQTKRKERLIRKLEFPGFLFFNGLRARRTLRDPAKRLIKAMFKLRRSLREDLTDQVVTELIEFLNSTSEKIEAIHKRLEETKLNKSNKTN